MISIVASGLTLENNFGCPSILHGTEKLLDELYGKDYTLHYFQFTKIPVYDQNSFRCRLTALDCSPKVFLLSALLFKFGIKTRNYNVNKALKEIKGSDMVVDLSGISFCDSFSNGRYSIFRAWRNVIANFSFLCIGKLYGKKTIKGTASFGPMNKKINYTCASIASKYIFDVIVAREELSRRFLLEKTKVKKPIWVAPDIANLMDCYCKDDSVEKRVGISVSHQILREWESEESYIDCIVNLCSHISKKLHASILLIPNEFHEKKEFNDISVANEIYNKLNLNGIESTIVDYQELRSNLLKKIIASCEVLVASRYHACVAALSAGVPVLVIGWHHKYIELLKWYGQEKWFLSQRDCDSQRVISAFDLLYAKKEDERKVIEEHYKMVRNAIMSIGKMTYFNERI